jgi:hypothetical protein
MTENLSNRNSSLFPDTDITDIRGVKEKEEKSAGNSRNLSPNHKRAPSVLNVHSPGSFGRSR